MDDEPDIFSAPKGWLKQQRATEFYPGVDEQRDAEAWFAALPFYEKWWVELLEEPGLVVATLLVVGFTIAVLGFIVRIINGGPLW